MLRIGGAPPQEDPNQPPIPPPDAPPIEPDQDDASQDMGRFDGEKVDPSIVHYMTADMGPFECGNCHHFDGQGGCGIVGGPIDPKGVCNLFTSQGQPQGGPDELPDDQTQPAGPPVDDPQAQALQG